MQGYHRTEIQKAHHFILAIGFIFCLAFNSQAADADLAAVEKRGIDETVAIAGGIISAFQIGSSQKDLEAIPNVEPTNSLEIMQVQIFLDEMHFGPGKIDGQMGYFTRQAATAFNEKNGRDPKDWSALRTQARKVIPYPLRRYQVLPGDATYINRSLPSKPEEQSKLKSLSYQSFAELISEKFHTDVKTIKRLNPKINIYKIRVGTSLNVPNVTEFLIEKALQSKSFKEETSLSNHSAYIDTVKKFVTIRDGSGTLLAMFPVTPGKERYIHRGKWKLVNMVSAPEFRYDKQMLTEGKRSDELDRKSVV